MAHHIVEDTAALEGALPEPWHVWASVFLGGSGEIGAAGLARSARPDRRTAVLDLRGVNLILEVGVCESDAFDERKNLFRFGNISRQGLLARDPNELASTTRQCIDHLFDIFDSRLIWAADPHCVYC